jgi:hypothetical protein
MAHAKNAGPGAKLPANANIEPLNALLRGELPAVDTYKLTLDNLEDRSKARTSLEACLQSHQQRASLLKAAIAQRGGTPAAAPGAWPALVELTELMAGDKAALAALEEGEEHELEDYRGAVGGLDPNARQLVEQQLLPKQIQSHHAINELRKTLH